MQLHLTIDELELVKRPTEDRGRLSCDAQAPIAQLSGQLHLQDKLKIGRDLVGKGLSRNLELGFDGLDDLVDLLTWRKNQLTKEISQITDRIARSVLEHRLSILNHFFEKVTEACAMI